MVLSELTETNPANGRATAADTDMPPAGGPALTASVIREDAPDLADHGGVSLAMVARGHEHLGHDTVQMGALVGDEAIAPADPGRFVQVRDDGMGLDPGRQPQLAQPGDGGRSPLQLVDAGG